MSTDQARAVAYEKWREAARAVPTARAALVQAQRMGIGEEIGAAQRALDNAKIRRNRLALALDNHPRRMSY